MDPATLGTLAETLAGLGGLAAAGMAANLFALRGLSCDEVPRCVRLRLQWWNDNVAMVLFVCLAVALIGLAGMAVTAAL
jgi:hypothetical protein